MKAKQQKHEPDLTSPLADTPLISEKEFIKKLTAVMSVSKIEIQELSDSKTVPPQKRGRKPKKDS